MKCTKCGKNGQCDPYRCNKLTAELNRAAYGQSGPGRKTRRKEVKLIYEHQLSGLDRIAFENLVYAGGEMPEEQS